MNIWQKERWHTRSEMADLVKKQLQADAMYDRLCRIMRICPLTDRAKQLARLLRFEDGGAWVETTLWLRN